MSKSLWFRRKKYGWGWTPANGKGWLVMIIYTAAVSAYPLATEVENLPMEMPLFIGITILLTLVLLLICRAKGEPPSWNWGDEGR